MDTPSSPVKLALTYIESIHTKQSNKKRILKPWAAYHRLGIPTFASNH